MTDDTPMATLQRLGIQPGSWATQPGTCTFRDGRPVWDLHVSWVNSATIRDLAFLLTENWDVKIAQSTRGLRIRINRPNTTESTS